MRWNLRLKWRQGEEDVMAQEQAKDRTSTRPLKLLAELSELCCLIEQLSRLQYRKLGQGIASMLGTLKPPNPTWLLLKKSAIRPVALTEYLESMGLTTVNALLLATSMSAVVGRDAQSDMFCCNGIGNRDFKKCMGFLVAQRPKPV